MNEIRNMLLVLFLLSILMACNPNQLNSTLNAQQLQNTNDSLQNIITSLNKNNSDAIIPPKLTEEFVYAIINYTVARSNLIKGTKLDGYYDLNGNYKPGLEIPDRYEIIYDSYVKIFPSYAAASKSIENLTTTNN